MLSSLPSLVVFLFWLLYFQVFVKLTIQSDRPAPLTNSELSLFSAIVAFCILSIFGVEPLVSPLWVDSDSSVWVAGGLGRGREAADMQYAERRRGMFAKSEGCQLLKARILEGSRKKNGLFLRKKVFLTPSQPRRLLLSL